MRAELKALLAAALFVYVMGLWWGIPWQWAPDELVPGYIIDAMHVSFAGGWHDKYPPVQYYLDALVCLPFVVASWFGWVDITSFDAGIGMLVLMRLLTLAMALGTLVAIYRTADELYGRRGAFAATLTAGFTPTVVFYAKLANVDAPSLFWFAWALRFYVRAVRDGEPRAIVAYGLTAVTAIATKDQTGGFFVLPSLHLAWLAWRRQAWRPLLVASAASLLLLVFELGIPFNLAGFRSHVATITGEASQPFRLPGSTWTRQVGVATLTLQMLAWSMTWPGLAAAVGGIFVELRRRRFLWLLLPVVSYYLFFLVVAGYVYDRFVIGVGFVLAIFAGGFVEEVLRADWPARRWRVAACAAGAAFIVWTGASMDVMMILDSRYDAARWMDSHRAGARVGLVGFPPYLPYVHGGIRLVAGPDDFTPAEQPKYIVVNAEVLRRELLPPVERAWRRWLEGGSSPYVVAARFKTAPRASFLSYTAPFRNGIEDLTTNLDKVGPEIVVYWRPGVLR
jgi:4-amino-4-deoxy-L-arabinose transferase-like glycosyltransferase